MFAINTFSRLVLLLTICSLVNSISPQVNAQEFHDYAEYEYLLYPNALKTQQFKSTLNFKNQINAMQYTTDRPPQIEMYYHNKMKELGWVEKASPEFWPLPEGLSPNFCSLYFERDDLCCYIVAMSNIDDVKDTLISIEISRRSTEQSEQTSLQEIAQRIAPIPLAPDATKALIMESTLTSGQITVNYESGASIDTVVGFYQNNMLRLGFREGQLLPGRIAGEDFDVREYKKVDQTIIISVRKDDIGKTNVLLMINKWQDSAYIGNYKPSNVGLLSA